jgi:hypothetical protein
MKYLILLSLICLISCESSIEEGNRKRAEISKVITEECKHIGSHYYCKFTAVTNNATTCIKDPSWNGSVSINCEFYEGLK